MKISLQARMGERIVLDSLGHLGIDWCHLEPTIVIWGSDTVLV